MKMKREKKSKKHKTKAKLVAKKKYLKTLHADNRRMSWKEKTTRYDS